MSNPEAVLELPWEPDGTLYIYVDADDGSVVLEHPDVEDAICLSREEWLRTVEFVTTQSMKRLM